MAERAQLYQTGAEKKSVNLSVNKELVAKAKSLGVNLSKTLEDALVEVIREKEKENWISENTDAIEEYNQRVEKDGVFSDKLRKF